MKAGLAVGALFSIALAGVSQSEPIIVGSIIEQLVEGHTVFATIETARATTQGEHFAAAVAVLVQEVREERRAQRFPGVLWFNDQFLVKDEEELALLGDDVPDRQMRYPCSGAVLATNDADADEIPMDENGTYHHGNNSTYVESYFIRDVHDHDWIVDKWRLPSGRLLWSVPILNDQYRYDERDDGVCEGTAYSDVPCEGMPQAPGVGCLPAGPRMSQYGLPTSNTHARSPGENGWQYPCGNETAACVPIVYNALLYFRLDDLDEPGTPKNHTEESDDWWNDVAGCDARSADYPCPDGDDHREGNSHPFNPERPWPAERYDGRDNHGGSDDCAGDGTRQADCHATRRIRVVYGYAAVPPERNYWLVDAVGSEAAYHCHDDQFCGEEDAGLYLD